MIVNWAYADYKIPFKVYLVGYNETENDYSVYPFEKR